jgi:hypothetical protein
LPPDLLQFQRDFVASIDRPATGAMAVYRNTVVHGAVEALRANYPVVEQVLGQEMFESVAVDFASQCPPRRPVLALYGARLAEWLEEQPWIGDLDYLPDVARVERLRVESLMAADADPLSAGEVKARKSAGLALSLHPSVRFDWLGTPAMSIWLAHQHAIGSEIAPEWRAEGALFVRPSPFVVHTPRIGAAAHRMLFGLRIGESANAAITAAQQLYPNEDCESVFAALVNLGLFAAISSERKPS